MYLAGRAPLPERVRVHGARRAASATCPTTPASACSSRSTARTRAGSARTRGSCASAPLVARHRPPPRQHALRRRQPRRRRTRRRPARCCATSSRELGVELTPEIAEALYIALVTDTGRFQYANTTPKALRLAAELVEAGADVHRVFQGVYESVQFAKLKLLARALERAQIYEGGRLVVSYLLRDDFAEVGAAEPYSEGIIDYLRAVEGAEMAVLIREPPRGDGPRTGACRCARALDELDVSAIARALRAAAGTGRRPGSRATTSIEEITEFIVREFVAATAAAPRACRRARLSRAGIVLVDKPAGPVVVRDRRTACAGARERGPATPGRSTRSRPGCCSCCPGRATKLAPCFVGLDKRYLTDVDLTRAHVDGRSGGRGRRGARAAGRGGARARGSSASAARSSCRSRPPRR